MSGRREAFTGRVAAIQDSELADWWKLIFLEEHPGKPIAVGRMVWDQLPRIGEKVKIEVVRAGAWWFCERIDRGLSAEKPAELLPPTPSEPLREVLAKASEERMRIYQKHEVQVLLNLILTRSPEELTPSFDPHLGYRYLEAESILDKPPIEVENLLEELSGLGILRREFYDKVIQCPLCNSANILTRYPCPSCNSHNLERGSVIEHLHCGHVDFESKFIKGEKLICPKCGSELKRIGVDYRKPGQWFRCRDCNQFIGLLAPKHYCRGCKHFFAINEAHLKDVYRYMLDKEVKSEVLGHILYLSPIKKCLEQMGYKVDSPGILEGASGIKHRFDILAVRAEDNMVYRIAIDVSATPDEEQQRIASISLFAKAFDSKPTLTVLLVTPKLTEETKRLVEIYNIKAVEAERVGVAVEKLGLLLRLIGRPSP